MGLRNILRRLLTRGAEIGGYNFFPFQLGRAAYPDLDYSELINRYRSWVYACASKNAVNCAQVPVRLYTAKPTARSKALWRTRQVKSQTKDDLASRVSIQKLVNRGVDIEEVIDHPLLDLLTSANDFMNGFDIIEGLFLWLELTGNSYIHVSTLPSGVPAEIWPLMPHLIRIIPDKERFIRGYEFDRGDNDKRVFEPEQILHFKYLHPRNALYGYGPLQAAILAAELHSDMGLYEDTMFKNGGIPDFAVVFPKDGGRPGPKEEERFRLDWKKRYGGYRKKREPFFAWGGAEIKQIAVAPKEMAFLQGRKATIKEIAAIFGVPESKLTVEDVNRANAEAGDYAYMKDTIRPRLIKVEQKLTERLCPMYDPSLFMAFDNPVPEDKEFKLKQRAEHIKLAFSSINEERAEDNRDPVPWGDVPYACSLSPLGGSTGPEQQPPGAGHPPESAESGGDDGKGGLSGRTKFYVPPLEHPTNYENPPLQRQLAGVFSRLEKSFFEVFEEYAGTFGDKGLTKSPADDLVGAWFNMEEWVGSVSEATAPLLRATLMVGARRALKQIARERQLSPNDPRIVRLLEDVRRGRIQGYMGTPVKRVRQVIAEGIAAGENTHQIKRRVKQEFEWLNNYGALRIARTETIWAWNAGAMEGYFQSGLVSGKKWITAGDERRCPFCREMDGKIVELTRNYFHKGHSLEVMDGDELKIMTFTYGDVGHPPLHPMCRCTIVPILRE